MKTKIKTLAIMAGALGLAVQANAQLYDVSFTETDGNGSVTASGQIDLVGGVPTSGSLTVIGGVNAGYYGTLLPAGSDANFTWDNVVNPGSTPFLDSTSSSGVVFANGSGTEINLWYEANGAWGDSIAPAYGLWGAPPAYAPAAFGTATLTAVPEPTTLLAGVLTLLPFGASGLRIFRKRQQVA